MQGFGLVKAAVRSHVADAHIGFRLIAGVGEGHAGRIRTAGAHIHIHALLVGGVAGVVLCPDGIVPALHHVQGFGLVKAAVRCHVADAHIGLGRLGLGLLRHGGTGGNEQAEYSRRYIILIGGQRDGIHHVHRGTGVHHVQKRGAVRRVKGVSMVRMADGQGQGRLGRVGGHLRPVGMILAPADGRGIGLIGVAGCVLPGKADVQQLPVLLGICRNRPARHQQRQRQHQGHQPPWLPCGICHRYVPSHLMVSFSGEKQSVRLFLYLFYNAESALSIKAVCRILSSFVSRQDFPPSPSKQLRRHPAQRNGGFCHV